MIDEAFVRHPESRAATRKLGLMVGLLLVPIFALLSLQYLHHNRDLLTNYIWMFSIAGAACALAGIALAIGVVRSTLARLDEVERAKQAAAEARSEAEDIAVRFASVNDDISRLNHELAQKVGELKSAQDEIIKKGRMEQLGQLTATIAHEIRNPLGSIRTNAFLLERQAKKHNVELGAQLERINNGVSRCDLIISQLLDFSRTREINADLGQLDEWLAKIIREEAQKLPETVYIECALGLDDTKIAFDPARMQRVIINLVGNASEALSLVQASTKPQGWRPSITVTTMRSGDFACIRVVDNGPGISPENMEKIREPLFTTKSFGTGLGIPAVEQIVTQHRGRLEIQSEPGNGATFSVFLPLPAFAREAA
jgi:signal transduction histidine kinase